jgi:type VI protein secretion system component VasF
MLATTDESPELKAAWQESVARKALPAAEALVREAENTDAFKQSVIEKIEVLRRDADADGSRAAEIAAEAYADCLQILKGE